MACRSIPPHARCFSTGARSALTQREFDLLCSWPGHPGRVFSRDQLIDLVWRLPFCNDSSTVTVHVRRLRAKIEPDPEPARFIQTVWGVGYRFAPMKAPAAILRSLLVLALALGAAVAIIASVGGGAGAR